ncbi:MAG: DUF883 family protein [Planctomycetaceae bacterium]|nr:DUF883 family protein [Planctomycetaceae bacterium]
MVNQQTLKGNWKSVSGKLRSHWGQLTDDDVSTFNGNVDQLVGLIQRKTGEGREAIEKFLDETADQGASMMGQATEAAGRYAQEAAQTVEDATQKASEALRQGYSEAEDMIRQRPGESIAVCFGAGVLLGLIVGLTMRSR